MSLKVEAEIPHATEVGESYSSHIQLLAVSLYMGISCSSHACNPLIMSKDLLSSEHLLPLALELLQLNPECQDAVDQVFLDYFPCHFRDLAKQIHLNKPIQISMQGDYDMNNENYNSRDEFNLKGQHLAMDEMGLFLTKTSYNGRKMKFMLIPEKNTPFFELRSSEVIDSSESPVHMRFSPTDASLHRDELSSFCTTSTQAGSVVAKVKVVFVEEVTQENEKFATFRLLLGNKEKYCEAYSPNGSLSCHNYLPSDKDDFFRLRPHFRKNRDQYSFNSVWKLKPCI